MPKYKTVVFDSLSELARLFFSKDMNKSPDNFEAIRQINNYTPTTERLNMLVRRCKNLKKQGTEVVFLAHEQLEKVYAKGGMIVAKGQAPQEPIAIKGFPDMPGRQTPEEFCRAADNIFRVRNVNGVKQWIARREPIGGGGDYWEVKDRFNALAISSGILPASYNELAELASKNPLCNWRPPYVWILYGTFGMHKTRSLLTFPRPMFIFDLDRGTDSITKDVEQLRLKGEEITIYDKIDVESGADYPTFISELEATFD